VSSVSIRLSLGCEPQGELANVTDEDRMLATPKVCRAVKSLLRDSVQRTARSVRAGLAKAPRDPSEGVCGPTALSALG